MTSQTEAATAEPDSVAVGPALVEFAPYGEMESDCPARLILDLFDNSWLLVIVYTLREGPLRHVQLRQAIGGISQKMLTQTLRRMERMALVERHRYPAAPPRVEYSLTAAGRDLLTPILALGEWVDRHGDTVRSSMYGGDIDD